jgi:hypothetical protein
VRKPAAEDGCATALLAATLQPSAAQQVGCEQKKGADFSFWQCFGAGATSTLSPLTGGDGIEIGGCPQSCQKLRCPRFGAAFDGIMNVSLQSIEVGRIFNPERIGQTNVNSLNPVWYSTENSESPNMMIFVQKFSAEL